MGPTVAMVPATMELPPLGMGMDTHTPPPGMLDTVQGTTVPAMVLPMARMVLAMVPPMVLAMVPPMVLAVLDMGMATHTLRVVPIPPMGMGTHMVLAPLTAGTTKCQSRHV